MEEQLWQACSDAKLEEVEKLLQNSEINTNWQESKSLRTPFFIACESGHLDIVKLLLKDERVDMNKPMNDGSTPLFLACFQGHVELVELLLNDKRVEVNTPRNNGATPFYIACQEEQTGVIKLLLNDERVEINKTKKGGGETPFYIACQEGQSEAVKLLLNDEKVEINQTSNSGATPFWIVCYKGYIDITKFLLNNERIEINKANKNEASPFWMACQQGHIEIVKILLSDKRIDINKSRNDGETPFYVALKEGHTEVVNVLRNEKNKLNLKEEIEKYNQNLKQNKEVLNSIGNLRDILIYFSETITLEIKQESIQSFVQAFKSCQEDQKKAFFRIIENISLNDEFTRIFKDVGGMCVLANSFIQATKDTQNSLLIPIVMIVNCNRLFREDLGKNSEFLNSLTTYLDEIEDMKLKIDVTGILLSLVGYISNKKVVQERLENIIFPIIRNNRSSEEQSMNNILNCLMEASAIDSSKSILLEFGTKEIIQSFVDNQSSPYQFISCIIQALLSSNDINQNDQEFGSNPTSPKVISKIKNAFQTFINSEAQFYTYTKGYSISCYNILKALGSLARNEANMKELKNNGIVKKIIEFAQNRKDNLLKTSERTIEELSTLIWVLSFDQDCKNEFLSNGIVEILKGFNIKDNESTKRAINGALFTLIGNQNQNQSRNEIKGQVMISYCWEEKEKARGIANYLQSKNIPIWIDIEQMEGSVLEKMAEAVEESSVILIFLSSKYKESQACRTEAEYAYKLKKEVICIMAEENYQPRGWLGALLGNKLWYNLWKNSMFIEEFFLPILSQLVKLLNQPNIVIQPQLQEKKQDQTPKPTQITQQSTTFSQSKSTDNDHHNQQILDLLEKMFTKMDEFENKLQNVETQNKENYEKLEQRFEKIETQNKESFEKLEIQNKKNFEKMETNSEQRFEQILEKLEKKKKSMFGK